MCGFCRRGNVGSFAEKRDAAHAAEVFAEARIARRLLAAQPVVEVRCGERIGKVAARGGGASISSICTVFAESEVVSLIGQGAPREDIAYAVVDSIAGKVVTQAKKLGGSYGAVCLTGGLCQTEYLPDAIAEKLGAPVLTHPQGRFAGAIGAALAARKLSR